MAKNTIKFSRLIGHIFGDGSIHKNKLYYVYTNSNNELQENVKNLIESIYKNVKLNIGTSVAGTPRYQYSNFIGKEFVKIGAPQGSKILQPISVPKWIMNGTKEIKSEFLGALFDDEGYFRDNKKCQQIVFKSSKIIKFKGNLINYLQQITDLLNSIGIETSQIKFDRLYIRKKLLL